MLKTAGQPDWPVTRGPAAAEVPVQDLANPLHCVTAEIYLVLQLSTIATYRYIYILNIPSVDMV